MIAVNAKLASSVNLQRLRFRPVTRGPEAELVNAHIRMGRKLPELNLPFPGTEPEAFIVVCATVPENPGLDIDLGISLQSMLLKAVEMGLGGLMIRNFDREPIREGLSLAQAYLSVGQHAAAADAVRKAIERPDANSFDALYMAASLLAQSGQRGDAANAMKRALAFAPANLDPRGRRERSAIFADGGMRAEADACLNEYLRTQPKDADAWLQLAIVKDALGQTHDAQNAIYQAYQSDHAIFNQRLQASEQLQKIAAPLFRRK